MTFPAPTAHSEDLITRNMKLAQKAAWAWHRKSQQPYDDLEMIAYIGLIKGCRKYNPEKINPRTGKPYALSTIVCPFIQGEILHWFRDRGYVIKFPHRWRESWGLVQRLIADPAVAPEEIAERAGLRGGVEELAEMLGAMRGTVNLDDHANAAQSDAPEVEIHRLGPLQQLIRKAWDGLHTADQGLLVAWWGNRRQQAPPRGPIQQFHWRVKSILRGHRLSQIEQLGFGITVEPLKQEIITRPPRRRRTRRELDAAMVQLGLLA